MFINEKKVISSALMLPLLMRPLMLFSFLFLARRLPVSIVIMPCLLETVQRNVDVQVSGGQMPTWECSSFVFWHKTSICCVICNFERSVGKMY